MTVQGSPKLSLLQLELLKIYAFNPTEEELRAVKNLLAGFFAQRFIEKTAHSAMERKIKNEDLDRWLEEDEQ